MTNHKPFDLEAAKAGAKVQTRDGRPVRIVCWDKLGDFPLVGILYEQGGGYVNPYEVIETYTLDGRCRTCGEVSGNDLFMSPNPHTVWRVIYRDADDNAAQRDFETEREANRFYCDTPYSVSYFQVEIIECPKK